MNLELLGFLKDGKYRLIVLKELNDNPLLPSELATKLNLKRSSISRILRDLKRKKLIESFSQNTRTRIYSITKEGQAILEELE